jgi:ubiquinone/menaquinone biosynthesis C-methylase UbiE
MAEFIPKQVTQYEASHLVELQGDVIETVTSYLLSLIPPMPIGSIIHGNACGTDVVTETIMASNPPPSITISTTDINTQFANACAATANKSHWPVTASVMSAQAFTFQDNYFTRSFTNFALHCLDGNNGAANQIYRTLKPGGIAIATIWTNIPHANELEYARFATGGKGEPPRFY